MLFSAQISSESDIDIKKIRYWSALALVSSNSFQFPQVWLYVRSSVIHILFVSEGLGGTQRAFEWFAN